MANKLAVLAKTGPRIKSQGTVDLETMAGRMSKNTTYNAEEIYSILRLYVRESKDALKDGETVKMDDFLTVSLSMKVGGKVKMGIRPDRGATADLNNPRLWTAAKVTNYANISKTTEELLADWDAAHPSDPVED
jgi:hypothetical protein